MKYVLKEGQYKVILKKDNLTVNKVVDIKRDQTEVLRLSGYTAEMTKTSKVTFSLSPSSASISIDGKEVDANKTIELNYGEYLVKVKADAAARLQVVQAADLFRASVIDVSTESVVIEATGSAEKLNARLDVLEPYGIREIVRAGTIALSRGPRSMSERI